MKEIWCSCHIQISYNNNDNTMYMWTIIFLRLKIIKPRLKSTPKQNDLKLLIFKKELVNKLKEDKYIMINKIAKTSSKLHM